MKKLMFLMAAAFIATSTFANTSGIITGNPAATISASQDKVEVKPEDLPEAVKATLAAAPYNEWKVEKAFLVPGENETSHFEISLSKGEEVSAVKLDKDGKVIE